ncbi:bifunctional 4-hydroxy-2-oxoglutarate aldolase/2-dehydro-3-deoxy-phosphogluconate aldolase [Candidatus Synechococcus spongiarum]|uniref:bifunctional 4-hydroxy-2-oxoglutarate aldolase/2-dehydro-3-deoxy-phosphogluconate aldolase n=1 Tax=Candidatus Synechococcus spongiarum TaxID=431041 RepID=UPI000942FA60|nr:bifunctional 4-hydroxy-2-oxoglutarate aldolase/2-dehydro-3-deoxy-phosphogluconate aldolase [Candidatus Synechococcus spongiarum]
MTTSLARQPLLAVLRPRDPQRALAEVALLQSVGWRHIELAWTAPWLPGLVPELRERCPQVQLGAASVTTARQLGQVAAAGLPYAFMPIWQPELLLYARELGITLVPSVFTPTEVYQARCNGCTMVKLFPATTLGVHYWSRLRAPIGPLPTCIAAGGLGPETALQWLHMGAVDAVALGQQLFGHFSLGDPALRQRLRDLVTVANGLQAEPAVPCPPLNLE